MQRVTFGAVQTRKAIFWAKDWLGLLLKPRLFGNSHCLIQGLRLVSACPLVLSSSRRLLSVMLDLKRTTLRVRASYAERELCHQRFEVTQGEESPKMCENVRIMDWRTGRIDFSS